MFSQSHNYVTNPYLSRTKMTKFRKRREGPPRIGRICGSIPSGGFFKKKTFAGLPRDPGQNVPSPSLSPKTAWFHQKRTNSKTIFSTVPLATFFKLLLDIISRMRRPSIFPWPGPWRRCQAQRQLCLELPCVCHKLEELV